MEMGQMVKLFMGSMETWMKENYWRPEERKSEGG